MVLLEVINEGCIGETIGAAEAAEAAQRIDDPEIAAAFGVARGHRVGRRG